MATLPLRPGLPLELGRLVATPGALRALTREEILTAISRHVCGDWGECAPEDAAENDFSLSRQLRILSVYQAQDGTKFWIITEADRSSTTILLPEEY